MSGLVNSIPFAGADGFFHREFLMMLEYHIPRLKNHPNTTLERLEPTEAKKFEGDLSTYLTSKGIPVCYHWAIMRVNNMLSMTELNEERLAIIIPPFDELDQLQQIWSSNNNLNY